MSRRFIVLLIAGLVMLAGCANTSRVVMGPPRAPIDPAQVQIYSVPPVGSQEIAQLESTSAVGFGTQGQTDAAIQRLKREAAALGANGVVLMGMGSERSAGGMSVGGGSWGRHSGGGVSFGIPTTQRRATGVAIYVPPGAVAVPAVQTQPVPQMQPMPPSQEKATDFVPEEAESIPVE
ncbi:MAG: hypothetical protein LBV45_03920 [Xanthomonadaceae bacterium]|nr:hypothetical protein [Xanthomonadaceae bacterium]